MNAWWESFHFLRPEWLLLAVPAVVIWWRLSKQRDPRRKFKDEIAPHLLNELVIQPKHQSKLRPTTLLLAIWLASSLALAGPSWRQEPSPFAEDQAGLMLVVRMTPSMETADLQPTRLERCRNKVHDLLELRTGGNAGLIAYAGTAHLVMPLTDDADIINHMLEALDPKIMPSEGDVLADALAIASQQITESQRPASILLIVDRIASQQLSNLQKWRDENPCPVQILAALANEEALAASGIQQAAKVLDATIVRLTPDDQDLTTINRQATSAVIAAAVDTGTRWRDEGYLLTPLLLLGVSLWGRRGWSIGLE